MIVFAYTVVNPRTVMVELLIEIYLHTPFTVMAVPGVPGLPGLAVGTDVL